MSTQIDRLEVEITSNSGGAAAGIEALATSLGKLKQNGAVGVAVKNLNNLTTALKNMTSVTSNANKISTLADAMGKLKSVGSAGSGVKKLSENLQSLKNVDYTALDKAASSAPLFEKLASSMGALSNVKSGGFGTMVNSLAKIGEVTAKLDDDTITRFANRVAKLNEELSPLSDKMTTIQAGLRGINSSAKTASNGVKAFDGTVKTARLNLANLITVIQGVKAAIMPIVRLLASTISDAMEWDGISYQFGNAFGKQADEYYEKITQITDALSLNKQTFMETSSMITSMLKGFGVGSADAMEMGLGYTELAYDIWAAYNNVYKSFDDAMVAVRSAVSGEVEPIRRAGFTIVDSQLAITAANYGLAYSSDKATEAQKSYLRYLTLVDQAHTKGIVGAYAKEMSTAEGLTRTLTQQVRSLAQAFGSLFLPILVKITPWLTAFVELLTEAIHRVAAFFGVTIQEVDWGGGAAGDLGSIGDAADGATGSLDDTTGAIEDTTDALKDLKKATVGIDELNVISPPSSSGDSGSGGSDWGTGGAGGGGILGDMGVGSLWDESIFDMIQSDVDKIKSIITDALADITAVISGFMLAIGTILVVTGANIPLGLGMMAVGAVGLAATIAQNWNGMSDQLARTLTTVTSVLGGFLLAIGAFLAFSGVNVGLGAALMVAGAVSLGTAATINWKFLNGDMKNTLANLTSIVGGALLAMGALFTFTGVSPGLGIALMLAGVASLATAVGLNWGAMSEPMRKAVGTLEAIVGGGLLALGAVLAFTGANIPLGVGMIASGAVSLGAAVALNWNSLTGSLKNTISTITALVSGALIGIGAILAFTGVATPMGIAMIAAGAVGIVATASLNWNTLTEKVKAVLKEIGAAVGIALLAVGAVLAFSGVALPLGISLMAVGAASLVGAVALNWNTIVESVKEVLQKIGIIAGAALLALGILLVSTGVALPLGIGLIVAGASSLAAGVALNWNAIVDMVRTTVEEIGIIAGAAMLALGVLLVCTGVALPLGIGLIAAGAASLAAGVALNWNAIVDKVRETVEEIGIIAGAAMLALGILLVCTGVGLPLGIGLIVAGAAGLAAGVALNWNMVKEKVSETVEEIGIIAGAAMLALGILLVCTGVGLPLGIGLIIAGASSLAAGVALNWNTIREKVQEVIDGIVNWVKTYGLLALGVILLLTGNLPLGLALLKQGLGTETADGGTIGNGLLNTIKEKWEEVKIWWNEKKGVLAAYTPNIGSIQSKLSSAWNTAKTWWDKTKTALAAYTPNIGSIKDKLSSAWSTAKTWWDKTKSALSAYTPSIGSIKEKLSSAWSTAKTWWTQTKSALSTYTPSIGSISTKLSTAWSNAKGWWNSKSGLSTYTPSIGSIKNKLSDAWDSAKKWWNNKDSLELKFKLPKIRVKWGEREVAGFTITYPTGFETYAKGGFPTMGQMFIANEAGPELVGNIGNRTAVANNDQIVEAVSEGVYSAVLAAMRASENNGSQSVNVYLDGRQITSTVEQRQRERGASIMGNQVYAY